ncbi:MAG: adenylate/guanylate cyclase domain-containing protein [Nitrososphaeraceae archaeon]
MNQKSKDIKDKNKTNDQTNQRKKDVTAVYNNTDFILKRMIGDDNINNKSNQNKKTKDKVLYDLQTLFSQRQDRFWDALKERYNYNTSIKRGQDFLFNHINSKISLVILYVDLVGSTKMSMTLPVDKLVTIIRAFSHELSSVVESYDGFVLKYVGDAIIAFFPSGFNKYLTCDRSVQCAKSMINVINNGLNSILQKYDYPSLAIKVGIDEGDNIVVQYGYDKSSPIDLLGYSMNVTAKIMSLTGTNRISVGEDMYKLLHPKIQSEFHELSDLGDDWKYINLENGQLYKIYSTN